MKIRFFYATLFAALLLSACRAYSSESDDNTFEDHCFSSKFLYHGIPDKYNTGANENTLFKTLDKEGTVNDVYIKIDERSDKCYVITSYIPKDAPVLPTESIIEDYDFSDGDLRIYNPDRYDEEKTITFRNCKFKGVRNSGPYDDNKVTLIFDHCSFGGGVSEMNIQLYWCKIGHFPTDAMNPLKNFTAQYCFIYDLSCEGNGKGTHIDGFQIYGRENTIGERILIDNVRFEIPSIYYEGNTSYVNACVMFQLEYGDVTDSTFSNLICNGGGKWFPIYFKKTQSKVNGTYFMKGEDFTERNVCLKNVKVPDIFDAIFYPRDHYETAEIENVEHYSELYVSSIFIDDDNVTHIICSNDTKTDKILKVQTNKGEFKFEIPHCPSNWALNGENGNKAIPDESLKDKNGRPYKSYRYKDLPFDIDCPIGKNISSIKCYDGNILLAEYN